MKKFIFSNQTRKLWLHWAVFLWKKIKPFKYKFDLLNDLKQFIVIKISKYEDQ